MLKSNLRKGRKFMKKFVVLICALTLVLSMSACSKSGTETTQASEAAAETTAAPAETLPAASEEVPVVTAKPLYGDLLDNYFDALLQGLEPMDYEDRGLNYLPGIVKDINEVGYCLQDMDGDGSTELLIGSVSDNLIYAMYTMKDDKEVQLIDAGERNTYQLTSDGVFLNRGSNGAASYGYNLYAFQDGEMQFQDALVYDAARDEANPWFYCTTETWDGDSMTPMETATAESTVADLEASVMEIGFVPFAQYTV